MALGTEWLCVTVPKEGLPFRRTTALTVGRPHQKREPESGVPLLGLTGLLLRNSN